MPESVTTETTQAPAEAPASEPQTLDEWVQATGGEAPGGDDLEADAIQGDTATDKPAEGAQPNENSELGEMRTHLATLAASLKSQQQAPSVQTQPVQQQNAPETADDPWEDAHKFLTDSEKGLGYTPEEAKGFTKALSGPISAIESRINDKLQRYEALAAMFEKQQAEARDTRLYEFLAKQPGGSEIYGSSDKRNADAIEATRLNAALIQQLAAARGKTLTDEQAIEQAHKIGHFDTISKPSVKGAVATVAANRAAKLASQAAKGTQNKQPQNPALAERDRFLQNASNDPLTRRLGFSG